MMLPSIHPENYFFAFSMTLAKDLDDLGIMQMEEDYNDKRRVLVPALRESRFLSETAITYNPPDRFLKQSNTVLARFWVETAIKRRPVYLFCRVETGSPAGWQEYTIIVTGAATNPEIVEETICRYRKFRNMRTKMEAASE